MTVGSVCRVTQEAEPGFRGRDRELGELRTAFHTARSGNARALLLNGDAGVGKSRLVGELVRYARAQEATVLLGTAIDIADAPAVLAGGLRAAQRGQDRSAERGRRACVRRWLDQRSSTADPGSHPPVRLLDELYR